MYKTYTEPRSLHRVPVCTLFTHSHKPTHLYTVRPCVIITRTTPAQLLILQVVIHTRRVTLSVCGSPFKDEIPGLWSVHHPGRNHDALSFRLVPCVVLHTIRYPVLLLLIRSPTYVGFETFAWWKYGIEKSHIPYKY